MVAVTWLQSKQQGLYVGCVPDRHVNDPQTSAHSSVTVCVAIVSYTFHHRDQQISMQSVARLAQATGRAALPVVGAGVAAVVAPGPGTAHADAPAAALDLPRRVTDEWELADIHDKSVVLFTPADIDNAVGFLTRCVAESGVCQSFTQQKSVGRSVLGPAYHTPQCCKMFVCVETLICKLCASCMHKPVPSQQVMGLHAQGCQGVPCLCSLYSDCVLFSHLTTMYI